MGRRHRPDAERHDLPEDLGQRHGSEQIYAYYADKGPKKEDGSGYASFADWVHPVSKARMLKAQHPEFETWYNGTHGAAGVTCADCHMPYQRLDGKKKVSQHQWTSPLRTDERIDTASAASATPTRLWNTCAPVFRPPRKRPTTS